MDSSGITAGGESFAGIGEFKKHLLAAEDQVAANFIRQLVVYATGGEIQFADRQEIDRIVEETGKQDYPVRTIVHKIVQSRIFRNK